MTSLVTGLPFPALKLLKHPFWTPMEEMQSRTGKKLILVEYQLCVRTYYMPYPILTVTQEMGIIFSHFTNKGQKFKEALGQ